MPDISLERTLPNNLEAERSVLGAILLDDKAVLIIFETLKPQDFYLDNHRRCSKNAAADEQFGRLTWSIEGAPACNESVRRATWPADRRCRAVSIEYYAQIIKEKSTLRLIQISNETIASYQDEDPAENSSKRRKNDIRNRQSAVPFRLLFHHSCRQRCFQAD
jgi:replicative DNA helicase